MPKSLKLLLTENVDNLGIVGDVVSVRLGYARNFLLPRNMATEPSDEAIQAVAQRREEAQKELAELRRQREELVHRLEGREITIQRSCNDQGILYASVTQQDIARALEEAGYPGVKPRDVRLPQNIKRVDTYEIHVKFETDLEADIKLWVVADRKLELDREEAPAAGAEGEEAPAEGEPGAAEAAGEAGAGEPRRAEKPERKSKKAEKEEKKAEEKAPVWGTPVSKPDIQLGSPRRGRGRERR